MNVLCSIVILFLIVFYSVCFYPWAYRFAAKPRSQNLVDYITYSKSSYIQAMYIRSFKHFLRGFLHSFLNQNYTLQISMLAASNLLEIGIIIFFRKTYERLPYFIFNLIYSITFLTFDMFLLSTYLDVWSFLSNFVDMVEFETMCEMILLVAMAVFTTLLFLCLLVFPVWEFLIKKPWKTVTLVDENPSDFKRANI